MRGDPKVTGLPKGPVPTAARKLVDHLIDSPCPKTAPGAALMNAAVPLLNSRRDAARIRKTGSSEGPSGQVSGAKGLRSAVDSVCCSLEDRSLSGRRGAVT